MKKAFIDQIMLGLLIFIAFIAFGATVANKMQAHNKFYKLKKSIEITILAILNFYNKVHQRHN